jgi:hypothetical protein
MIPAPAVAATSTVYLATPANRDFQGEIQNKGFEKSLEPTGELGVLVFQSVLGSRTWVIDAALLDDVNYLVSQDSTVAKNWLDRLKKVVGGDTIYATAYGNPDVPYLKALAPAELSFYYQFGEARVSELLDRNVRSEQGSGLSTKRANISNDLRRFFNEARQEFNVLAKVINPKLIQSERAKLGQLFNPQLNGVERQKLFDSYRAGQSKFISKLRIVSGRYQITTANQKMPITLVNEFDSPAKVDLLFRPLNNRVVFPEYRGITLAPKSKIQVSVPIKTIAAGDTTVVARFENGKGKIVGANAILDLSSTIISPAVSRFTTGAGIVLVFAAIAQSVRRIRKSRKA